MTNTSNAASAATLHPVLWVAGISVTLLSLAGIAALTGLLPPQSVPAPERPAIVAAAQAAEPPLAVVAPAAPVVVPPASTLPASKTIPAVRHKTANKRVAEETPVVSPPPPPPLASGVPPDYVPPPVTASAPAAPPPCPDCGVIGNVRQVTHEGHPSGAGAIVGGLAGGALANTISHGGARTVATIAGAVGGGLLGNSIEKSQRTTVGYQVAVRMEDGATRLIDSPTVPPWRIGDRVRLVSGTIVSR